MQSEAYNGTTPEEKIIELSPSWQQTLQNATIKTRGFCKRFSHCLVMGPAIANRVDQEKRSMEFNQLQRQVEEIDKELQKQKQLNGMYRRKLQRARSFLTYCLQVAQDNGFLDLLLINKDHELSLSPTTITTSPGSSFQLAQFPPELRSLLHQAKINGWYIDHQEIEMQHLSAQGTTADVYMGTWRGFDVAIKCVYPDFFLSNENGFSFFAQEVETLSRQRHPLVLQLMGVSLDPPQNCWIVTEFFNSNLKDWLHGPGKRQKERTIPLPPFKHRIAKALEISQAMQYLHESKPKTIHRDLKPSNIFLDDALHVKVADFGHTRYLTDGEKALTGETGTFVYMAPEVVKSSAYDEKCDVYSFGIILNELATGAYPYIETDYGPSKIALEVAENGLRPSLYEQMEGLDELIKRSWNQEPASRPTFGEITSHLRILMEGY